MSVCRRCLGNLPWVSGLSLLTLRQYLDPQLVGAKGGTMRVCYYNTIAATSH